MQAKLGAGFLTVALLYIVVGFAIGRSAFSPAYHVVLVACSYVAIGLAAAWILSNIVGRRLRELSQAAAEISKGDLTLQVDTAADDETGDQDHG